MEAIIAAIRQGQSDHKALAEKRKACHDALLKSLEQLYMSINASALDDDDLESLFDNPLSETLNSCPSGLMPQPSQEAAVPPEQHNSNSSLQTTPPTSSSDVLIAAEPTIISAPSTQPPPSPFGNLTPATFSPPAQQKPSQNLFSTSTNAAPSRCHLRAKSVASIFELGSTTQSSLSFSNGVRDDWDMPMILPACDPTCPQKDKSPAKNVSQVPVSSHPTQKLNQHNPKSCAQTNVSSNLLANEVPSARHSKSTLACTSSAGTIKQFTKLVQASNSTPSYSSRSDDESALTWQQPIIRPTPKHSLFSSQSDHPLATTDVKPVHKKPQTIPNGFTTPVKNSPVSRKPGVNSTIKTKPSSILPSSKRRNSLSFGHAATNQPSQISPVQPQTGSLSAKAGQDILAWKSFPSSAVNHYPDLSLPSAPRSPLELSSPLISPTNHSLLFGSLTPRHKSGLNPIASLNQYQFCLLKPHQPDANPQTTSPAPD